MKLFESDVIVKFKNYVGGFYVSTPVQPSRKIRANWMKAQTEKKFSQCPGMWDYANAGYIITAHADIHIKANKAGIIVKIDSFANQELKYYPFDFEVVKGMAPIQDSVKQTAGKIALPWSVQMKKGYSGYCIPALLHSEYLDKIFVYPGVVDYDNFHSVNFVFSPLKECEFVIPAGTPLLQILPFKREDFTAECGKATDEETDKHRFNIASRVGHYYRKYLSRKKTYAMKCPYEHRLPTNERPEEDK